MIIKMLTIQNVAKQIYRPIVPILFDHLPSPWSVAIFPDRYRSARLGPATMNYSIHEYFIGIMNAGR